jgi:hypothetical protein
LDLGADDVVAAAASGPVVDADDDAGFSIFFSTSGV